MEKNLLKLISLLVSVLLFAAFAVGCGTNNNPNEEVNTDETQQQNDEQNEANEETEEPEETYDFGGRTITYAAWWNPEPDAGVSQAADLELARRAELQEKYNVKLASVEIPYDNMLESFTASALAGEPLGDIVWMDSRWVYPELIANGFFTALDDLEAFDFEDERWNQDVFRWFEWNGKHYSYDVGKTGPDDGLFWNKTMFEREGLPNLYELQANKEWTWDKMLEIAQKATKDLDGDGIIDQWGLGGTGLELGIVFSNNAETIANANTTPQFALNSPNAIEALQFYQDLIHKYKVVEITPAGAPWDYARQQFTDGKLAMNYFGWWTAEGYRDNMQDDYGFVLLPMGPQASEYTHIKSSQTMRMIPSGAKNPEEIAIFEMAMTAPYPELEGDSEAWKEGFEAVASDTETIETIRMIREDGIAKMNFLSHFNEVQSMWWGVAGNISNANTTPQVAVDEVAQQAQVVIDDTLEQKVQ